MLNLIYDRSSVDVLRATDIRTRIQNGDTVTATELQEYLSGSLKGGYTYTDLNRVEQAMLYISDTLNQYAYSVTITTKNWTATSFFKQSDYLRWESNLNALKGAFIVYSSTPTTPNNFRPYQKANDIEKILFDLEELIEKTKAAFRPLGTFELGGNLI